MLYDQKNCSIIFWKRRHSPHSNLMRFCKRILRKTNILTLLLDSGVLGSRVVREVQLIFKTIEQ
jgi:hypothetical protein